TDPEVVTSIVTSFGASPLLLEQGIATLVETSAIVREDVRWAAVDDLSVRGAASMRDVVAERLDRLPDEVRTTAALAAASGSVVAAEAIDRDGVDEHLATLASMDLVVPDGDGRFRWTHPSVRESAAAGVPPAAAADLLGRLARRELESAGLRRWRHAASVGSRFADAVTLAGHAASDEARAQAVELLLW